MRTGKPPKLLPAVLFVIVAAGVPFLLSDRWNPGFSSRSLSLGDRIADSLTRKLAAEKPLAAGSSGREPSPATLIYVLGGNQDSLATRFRKAASLYHRGLSRKILILDRPGITEFSPDLGRNLTNNEWAIRELERLEVRKEDVEPVSVQTSFLGTLSEARDVADFAHRKGCRRLILVSSTYHTRRVLNAFSRFARRGSLELYVYGAGDTADLHVLLPEYFKLVFYDLIP
jgi:hypothetical protein